MTKLQLNFGIRALLVVALTVQLAHGQSASGGDQPKIFVKQPNDIKIFVHDNSRVLTDEEAAKLPNRDSIPIVNPIVKPSLIDSKSANPVQTDSEKLPPIPLINPVQFPFSLFDSLNDNNKPAVDQPVEQQQQQQPKGIISVLLMKTSHKLNDDQSADDQSSSNNGLGFRSFIILKYLPKSVGNLFGLDSSAGQDATEDENTENLGGQKLLGGDDDVDNKRESVHLLGGGGENDPDRLRFRIDSDKGVFTGGDDLAINSQQSPEAASIDQHRFIMFSMLDRIRNIFNSLEQSGGNEQQPQDDDSSPPFIIRTDDGSAAILPNDIGYAEKQQQQQSLNKCMMLNFMRLKASMYYRTILHLLFFTGVLLFIMSLIMLTIRTYKRRRYVRHPMSIATIDGGASQSGKEAAAAAAKFNSYRGWSGDMVQTLIGSSDSKLVLIQAPPAYDQVIINDKTSSLTSNPKAFATLSSSVVCNNNRRTSSDDGKQDDCETKSLPPDYDEGTNTKGSN